MAASDATQAEIDHILAVFPERLQQAMSEKNLDVHQLAFATGINSETVRAYVLGSRLPRTPQLALVTRALDESADWLLGVYDRPDPDPPAITTPSPDEAVVLTAIAAENDAQRAPTFLSISQFAGYPKGRVTRIVKRLELAGWVAVDQEHRYSPGGLTVTARYHNWLIGKDEEC